MADGFEMRGSSNSVIRVDGRFSVPTNARCEPLGRGEPALSESPSRMVCGEKTEHPNLRSQIPDPRSAIPDRT